MARHWLQKNFSSFIIAGQRRRRIPAVAYVRMSTEHQQYSTENQLDRIKEYAARRGMNITRVFAAEWKSGLSVKGRESLRRMIAEGEVGNADFKCIIAYDVSRWGRFQDADESGYYEIHLQTRGHHWALLRRAIRERRLAHLEHHQKRQTRPRH